MTCPAHAECSGGSRPRCVCKTGYSTQDDGSCKPCKFRHFDVQDLTIVNLLYKFAKNLQTTDGKFTKNGKFSNNVLFTNKLW